MESKRAIVFLLSAFVLLFSILYVSAEDIMTMEVDLIADDSSDDDVISVQVPDKLDFGQIKSGQKSEEFKVYVNNTGNVDITVTPKLVDTSEEIFSYLYFRKLKTSGGVAVEFNKIGDFSFNITKPSSGNSYNDEYFYTILDLTSYNEEISSDILNHRANVKFYAVAK